MIREDHQTIDTTQVPVWYFDEMVFIQTLKEFNLDMLPETHPSSSLFN